MDQTFRTLQQIGAALRRYRKKRDLTQGNLGSLINKRRATIWNLAKAARLRRFSRFSRRLIPSS